eukprot:TRINITY_DN2733_c0_g1_i2.p1 TRINITY_DN2733_c0_g1~~TRINITY_DN2733_c0_g1_i2.p1  ORF type:complete len:290 (+),score=37.89 TRINITY_DN2733_c0_g1_i2:287-1156(+)
MNNRRRMAVLQQRVIRFLYCCLTMATCSLVLLVLSGFLGLPTSYSVLSSVQKFQDSSKTFEPFTDVVGAFRKWDTQVGCSAFRDKYERIPSNNTSLQEMDSISCSSLKQKHVSVLVKGWTWIPDNLNNLYSCRCGLSCLWTKSEVLADQPDAHLFETQTPPFKRHKGEPLRVYMDLEAGRNSVPADIFVSYHAGDDVQATYAGAQFHSNRNYYVSPFKNNNTLVYWSSSRCLKDRNELAEKLFSLLPCHSFGKCLNNVGGRNKALVEYPECQSDGNGGSSRSGHLHCAM